MEQQGRRAHSDDEFWGEPGVFWRWETEEGDGHYVRWMVRPPCGHHFMLAGGSQDPPHHCIEEHDDEMITVRANPPGDPTNSNSILCPTCGWHGYLDHGKWVSV